MRRAAGISLTFAALLSGASAAHAATRFVATTGTNAANTCLVAATPCKTIAHAVSVASAGDTISIGAGTFAEGVAVTVNNLTFAGAGSGATFVDASATTSPGFDVGDDSTSFQNLHIRGGITPGGIADGTVRGAIEGGGVSIPTIAITGCTLDQASLGDPSGWDSAVEILSGDAALTITATTIDGYGSGVESSGADGSLTINGSTIVDPFMPPPTGLSLVLGSGAGVVTTVPTTISDSNVTSTEGVTGDDTTQLTVTRTIVHASQTGVAQLAGSSASTVTLRDTVIAPGGGSLLHGIDIGSDVPSPVAPTLSLTGVSVLALSDTNPRALSLSGAPPNTVVHARNTILQALDPLGATNDDIGSGAKTINWDVGFTAFTTTTGTDALTPGAGTNIDAAPQYVDDALGDLHLQLTSPLFDKGDPSQVLPGETDVAGAPRAVDHDCDGVAQPDLGAYEAPSPPCPAPPAPPTPPAPPATPPATPAKDTTPPVISSMSFDPTTFAADHTHPHHGRHIESTLRFTLSEAATLTVDVELVTHHSGGHPATYSIIGSVTYHGEKQGANTRTFSGLIGSHPLHSAEYRTIAFATDASGNVSSHHHVYFTVDNT
jgi:hypothetical protein